MAPLARTLAAFACLLAAACGGKASNDSAAQPTTFLKQFGGTSEDRAVALSTYADGSTVAVGTVFNDTLFGAGEPGERLIASFDKRSVYVARLSPEGALLGVEPISGDLDVLAGGVAAVADGAAIVTGTFRENAILGLGQSGEQTFQKVGNSGTVFVARFQADGSLDWASRIASNESISSTAVAAFPDGSSVLGGYYEDKALFGPGPLFQFVASAGKNDGLVARFAPDGAFLWARTIGSTEHDRVEHVAALPDGTALVAGTFRETMTLGLGEANETTLASGGPLAVFLARYASHGALLWARTVAAGPTDVGLWGFSALDDGTCVATGRFGTNVTIAMGDPNEATLDAANGSAFVVRYNSAGAMAWVRQHDVFMSAACIRPDGVILVGGSFQIAATIGGESFAADGIADGYYALLNPDGTVRSARHLNSTDQMYANAFGAHADGSWAIAGIFQSQSVFGRNAPVPIPLQSLGNFDVYVGRLNPDGDL